MKNRLILAAIFCIISSSTNSSAISFGGKFGINNTKSKISSNDNGSLFGGNTGDNKYSSKSKNSIGLDAFISKNIFNIGSIFIDGELSASMNSAKSYVDANNGKMVNESIINKIKIKEKLGATDALNIGVDINKDTKIYAKLGAKLSRLNISQEYNPDPTKQSIIQSNDKINPGFVFGIGLNRYVSDHLFFIAEGTYNISNLKIKDFEAEIDSGPSTILNAHFKNRKANINYPSIKIGIGFAL